jgi:hypothetical protein
LALQGDSRWKERCDRDDADPKDEDREKHLDKRERARA